MNRAWVAAFVLAFSAGMALAQDSGAADADAPQREARLVGVSGTVYLHLHEHPDDEFVPAAADASLAAGDMVRTGSDGSAELALDGDSIIELGHGTDFIVNSLDSNQTEFHLGLGSLLAKLRSLTGAEGMSFRTSNSVAAVRGTELGVASADDGQPTQVGVFDEGHVAVQSAGAAGEVQLGPGQETQALRGSAPAQAHPLRALAAGSGHMSMVRQRLSTVRRSWKPRSPAQQSAARGKLLGRKRTPGSKLKGVPAGMKARNYKALAHRRENLRRQSQRRAQLRRGQRLNRRRRQQKKQQKQQRRKQQKAAKAQPKVKKKGGKAGAKRKSGSGKKDKKP
jgi:hypothetical protein